MDNQVPTEALNAFRMLEESVGELDAQLERAKQADVPEFEDPDPSVMAAAYEDADAPAEMRAVARAVAEGRTSWEEIAAGGASDVPEVQAVEAYVIAGGGEDSQAGEDARGDRSQRDSAEEDEEDFSQRSFLEG